MRPLNLLACTEAALAERLAPLGLPAYRLDQIRRWVFEKLETDVGAFSDLPAKLRTDLAQHCTVMPPTIEKSVSSGDGKTHKLLLKLSDEAQIECVYMTHGKRRPTFCVSSQTGCAQGCVFCATGRLGRGRNLNPYEMVQQVWVLRRYSRDQLGKNLAGHNVVFMGMGEPLDNLSNLVAAIKALTSKETFGLSPRAITVSTVGIPGGIRKLARADLGVALAVSLNASDDETRHKIMPGQGRRPIEHILDAAKYFFETTKRRVTIEYVLVKDVNDGKNAAIILADRLRGLPLQVNLIPCNAPRRAAPPSSPRSPSPSSTSSGPPDRQKTPARKSEPDGGAFAPPSPQRCNTFLETLKRYGIKATLRRSQGADIAAACGQLAPRKQREGRPARKASWAKARPKKKRLPQGRRPKTRRRR